MIKKLLNNRKAIGIFLLFCIIVEAYLEFKFHRRFIFLWDDEWYATHLITEVPLQSLKDIWEGQVWHYFNWGGRVINHGLLQLVLMQGEFVADVLNMIVTFILCFIICKLAEAKSLMTYCIAFIALISFNTDIKLSMFWQSGSVNYLYSSIWILSFILVYLRHVKNPEAKSLKFIWLWIIPLGLITGWSNENMGPAACVTSGIVIFYFIKILHKKAPFWMWLGMISSLCGSVLLILAPGNFVRNAFVEEASFFETLFNRCNFMLMAGMSYLFPSILFTLLFLLLYLKTGHKIQAYHIILMLTALLAYGAMFLSPTFPNRAAFGIMAICIALVCSFIEQITDKDKSYLKYVLLFSSFSWIFALYTLYSCYKLPL